MEANFWFHLIPSVSYFVQKAFQSYSIALSTDFKY